jgi:hypothetical protein
MTRSVVAAIVVVLAAASGCGRQAPGNPYLGQEPPGLEPQVFAPGVVSSENHEFAPSFSPDGTEFYFSRGEGPGNTKSVMVTRLVNGVWTQPEKALPFENECFEARVAPGGDAIFFMGFSAKPGGDRPDIDMFSARRTAAGWADVKHLDAPFNPAGSMYISFTDDGTLYTSGVAEGGIVKARPEGEGYAAYELLPAPVNTDTAVQVYPFIAPDGTYLIFNEMGGTRAGQSGLLVAFRNGDGSWTEPLEIPLGMRAGTASVSPDGKYLFFTSGRPGDIYWVDAAIFKNLRD